MSDVTTTLPEVEVTAPAVPAVIVPWAERIIILTIALGKGNFGNSGSNTVTLVSQNGPYSTLRILVQVQNASAPNPTSAVVVVYGLTLDQINQLTLAGIDYGTRSNYITIQAGDTTAGMATVFNGTFFGAYPRGDQPDMAFVILANPANAISLTPAAPTSIAGPANADTVFGSILSGSGYTLTNNGVTGMARNPYHWGSVWNQCKQASQAFNCEMAVDSTAKTITISPRSGSSAGAGITLSPDTGMIGYPEFDQNLIRVRHLYSQSLVNRLKILSSSFNVQSQFKPANRKWTTTQVDVNLAAQLPGGPWEIVVTGAPFL
jgi:hypothetical protein